MSAEIHPKVFISYSWTVQDWVVEFAQRLVNAGIDTIVDFWNLKPEMISTNLWNLWLQIKQSILF